MKKYRFIGNMEDVTPCGNMDERCIIAGCKGKTWGQCQFDPNLNLLPSGNEFYEEVRDTVFRVEKDGAEVVEYALVEVKRTPVKKFVEGGE